MAELEQRLRERGADAEGDIARRLARAREEIALWRTYDYLIVNRDVKEAMGPAARRHPGGALPDRASVAHAPRPGGVRVMAFPSLESALNKVSNRYLLVVLSAKRARQLNRGAPPRVDSKHKKPTSSALEEIAAAKIEYRIKEADETQKA